VPLVQEYFDQGLRLYYAFNHAESIRAFEEAARRDPTCAICHWGTAMAYGPNINAPMGEEQARAAWAALQRALAGTSHASDKERALIAALATRYGTPRPEDRAALDSAYARHGRGGRALPGRPRAAGAACRGGDGAQPLVLLDGRG
jgi:surface antigen